MALRPTTVRFDERSYELVRAEAKRAGMTVAQFVREAALIRATLRAVADENGWTAADLVRAWQLCSEHLATIGRGSGV